MRATRQGAIIWSLILLINGLLVLQFLLGMAVNLFATIPFAALDAPARSFLERIGLGFAYAREAAFLPLQLHWLTASLLILASLVLLVIGIRAHRTQVWALALLLFVSFSVATVSGAAFIGYAGSPYYSMSMATAFIIAALVSVYLLLCMLRERVIRRGGVLL